MSRHDGVEYGMGFSGLVPTEAERKQDECEKTLWGKIREKERRILELEAENKRQTMPDTVCAGTAMTLDSKKHSGVRHETR